MLKIRNKWRKLLEKCTRSCKKRPIVIALLETSRIPCSKNKLSYQSSKGHFSSDDCDSFNKIVQLLLMNELLCDFKSLEIHYAVYFSLEKQKKLDKLF